MVNVLAENPTALAEEGGVQTEGLALQGAERRRPEGGGDALADSAVMAHGDEDTTVGDPSKAPEGFHSCRERATPRLEVHMAAKASPTRRHETREAQQEHSGSLRADAGEGIEPEGKSATLEERMPSRDWRKEIFDQVSLRDRPIEGLVGLYQQYSECLQSLQNLRTAAATATGTTPCPSPNGGCSPVLGPRSGPHAEGDRSPELLPELELPQAVYASERPSELQQLQQQVSRLRNGMRLKEQEMDTLQHLVKEREEELHEKEVAHTELCRQATLLGRENHELKAQLQRTQEQLRLKTSEADRLAADARRLQQVDARGGHNPKAGAGSSGEAPVLPECRLVLKKIHGAELTCIAAVAGQSAPLPRTLVAVGTADGFVKLLDGATARPHAHLSVSRDHPRLVAVDLAPGSGMLLAAASDHALRLLDLRAQRLLHVLRGHLGPLSACGFLRGGGVAFTAGCDRTVKLWDLEKGQTVRSIPTSAAVTGAGVHPSSGMIVVGHSDGSLAVLDPRVNESPSPPSFLHKGHSVVGVRVAPDGRKVVSQGEDGIVCIAMLDADLRCSRTLEGLQPAAGPSPPAWSPNGAHVLARGADSLRCWIADTGALLHTHEVESPACVCWDLPQAVSAHSNGHAALWGAASSVVDGVEQPG